MHAAERTLPVIVGDTGLSDLSGQTSGSKLTAAERARKEASMILDTL